MSVAAPLCATYYFTYSYYRHFYTSAPHLFTMLCIFSAIVALLYTLPAVNVKRRFSKVLFLFVPYFTVYVLTYNVIAGLIALFAGVIIGIALPRKSYYTKILFTSDNTPFKVKYTPKASFDKIYYRTALCVGGFMTWLLAFSLIFTTPSYIWQVKAFPNDFTVKETFSEDVLPSGEVTSAFWYDTNALLVADFFDIETPYGTVPSPALTSGLETGDIITKINGQSAYVSDFIEKGSDGTDAVLTVKRAGSDGHFEDLTISVTPVYSTADEKYLIGMSFYTSATVATSVQTVSFVYPDTGYFAATAHSSDDIYENPESLTGVLLSAHATGRDEDGLTVTPGEITGSILHSNDYGTFGITIANGENPLPIAKKSEVRLGSAVLVSDFEGEKNEYSVFITGTYRIDSRDVICFIVTDDRLIAKGGITRGMSGSPIVQKGKVIGALSNMDQGGYSAYATYAHDMAHELFLAKDIMSQKEVSS